MAAQPSFSGERRAAWFLAFLLVAALLVVPDVARGGPLSIEVNSVSGLGRVTSNVGGISCPPTCDTTVTPDSPVTLTATPAAGYVFGIPDDQGGPQDATGWEGCTPVPGVPLRCTLTVPAAGATVFASFRPAALLLVVANGSSAQVFATVANPKVGEEAEQICDSADQGGKVCPFPYLPGRTVTLTPSPLDAPYPIWSDDDCLSPGSCTVVLDEPRQAVTATFRTLRVFVRLNGPGHVLSTPPGIDCTTTGDDPEECTAIFQTGQDVALTAQGETPRWVTDPSPARAGCDYVVGTTCHLIVERARWGVVSFNGVTPDQQYPPLAGSRLIVRKNGTGGGTVRGGRIDCGSRCSMDGSVGDKIVLVAEASRGSRFVRWRRACGTRARCPLTIGTVTRVRAQFDRVAVAASPPPKLAVTLERLRVKRVGRRYLIRVRLALNRAAAVTARVTRPSGRRVAVRRWQLPPGDRTLSLRVKARRGRYRLVLRIRSTDGQVQLIQRRLRLRR